MNKFVIADLLVTNMFTRISSISTLKLSNVISKTINYQYKFSFMFNSAFYH